MLGALPRIIAKLDEPFGDASLLPTFLLCEFTREHVTVAVGGDGGDELLLGYPTFQAEPFARLFRKLPAPVRRWARELARHLPVDTRNFSLDFVVRSFLSAADAPDAERHPLWLGSVIPDGPDDPLVPDLRRDFPLARVLEPAVRAYREAPARSHWQRLSYQYCHTYLPDDILHKVDRASMMVSLEARSPFLDPDLVEFVGPLPPRYKRRWTGASKGVLKRATAPRLPRSVLERSKKGFGVPIAAWLKGPLAPAVDELLEEGRLRAAGYLRPEVVRRLVEEHRSGARNHRKTLWTLMSFEWWRTHYAIGARN
jgi:asparagine synthase (glutamine-hydrolysing)